MISNSAYFCSLFCYSFVHLVTENILCFGFLCICFNLLSLCTVWILHPNINIECCSIFERKNNVHAEWTASFHTTKEAWRANYRNFTWENCEYIDSSRETNKFCTPHHFLFLFPMLWVIVFVMVRCTRICCIPQYK